MSAVLRASAEAGEIAWAMDHLQRARRLRLALERATRGTGEYGNLNHQRHMALERAKVHVARLVSLRYPLPADLVTALHAEGLVA